MKHELIKLMVWEKAEPIPGRNPNEFRIDCYGRIMKFSDYGRRDSTYDWEIDHILPKSKDGSDDITNLQALHWLSNQRKIDHIITHNQFDNIIWE